MSHSTPELRPVPGIVPTIRDRWVVVAVLVTIGLLGGILAALVLPQDYQATTTVMIGANVGAEDGGMGDVSGTEQATVATLEPQLVRIAGALGKGATAKQVSTALSVSNAENTTLLDFNYIGDSAAAATRGADVSAAVYVNAAQKIGQRRLTLQSDQIRRSLPTASLDQRVALQAQLRTLQTTVVTPGVILKDADGTAKTTGVPSSLYVPLGLLVGLIIGVVAIYVLEGRRPRVRAGSPLPLGGVPVLGRIRREDTPASAAPVFVVPSLVDRPAGVLVGVSVLGRDPEALVDFAREALSAAEVAGGQDVVMVDLATTEGLRAVHEVGGVLLVVREQDTAVSDVESTLDRLEALGVATYGVVTAPRSAGRDSAATPAGQGRGEQASVPGFHRQEPPTQSLSRAQRSRRSFERPRRPETD